MSIVHIARPAIRALKPYVAAEQLDDTVRLNANESPWACQTDSFRRPLNRYPEIRPTGVRARLASYYQVESGQLIVTRGSSEAIDMLLRVFCRDGQDNIVTIAPGFSMYAHYAHIQGASVRTVNADPAADFVFSARDVINACDDNSRVIFLCNPNNPTGTRIAIEILETVLDARSGQSAVVVDEAYIEFAEGTTAISLLRDYPNLIVLRTLSKALAAAGARCGVALGDPDVISLLDAVQAPYAIATPVAEWIEDALATDGLRDAAQRVGEIISERNRMAAALGQLPCVRKVWRSDANFLLVRVVSAVSVLAQARGDGILLRHFAGELADCVRITIGSQVDNDRLLSCLAQVKD
jgi:histidinol-phosphate aminotransferase